jgi:ferritin
MTSAFNGQINAELYSAYLYLSMSAWFAANGLPGAANWTKVQAKEEMTHADMIFSYLIDRDGKVELEVIEKPEAQWASPIDVFEAILAHERKVTALLNALMDEAIEYKDHAAKIFLQWFINEQVEEEASAKEVLDDMKMAAETKGGLFMIDRELAKRVFVAPVAN